MKPNKDLIQLVKRMKGKYCWITLPMSKHSEPVYFYDPEQWDSNKRTKELTSFIISTASAFSEVMEEMYPEPGEDEGEHPKPKPFHIKWKKKEIEGIGMVGQFTSSDPEFDRDKNLPKEAHNYKFSQALFLCENGEILSWKAGSEFYQDKDLKVVGMVKEVSKMISESKRL